MLFYLQIAVQKKAIFNILVRQFFYLATVYLGKK